MLLLPGAPLADRRLLPGRGSWLTPWLVAVLMFVTVVVGAAGLALANAAATVTAGAAQRWSVQVSGGARLVPQLVAAARSLPGVVEIRAVPDAEVRALLARWLGSEVAESGDLPVPGIVDVTLAPGTDAALLEKRIRAVAPGARVESFDRQLGPLLGALRTLQGIALAIVLLMVVATAAAITLATRGAFDSHRATVSVLHGIGATDEQLARLFQQRMAREALIGGVAGTILALLLVLLMLVALGGEAGMLAGGPPLRPLDLVVLGLLPIGAGLLSLLVARVTVLRALRADP